MLIRTKGNLIFLIFLVKFLNPALELFSEVVSISLSDHSERYIMHWCILIFNIVTLVGLLPTYLSNLNRIVISQKRVVRIL